MDDQDKQLLKSCSSFLEFEDDVTEFKCIKCRKLAIDHFLCDCNYVFCDFCIQTYGHELCPKCRRPISKVSQKDPSFEEELLHKIVHCPNTRNGCRTIDMLIEILKHLRRCRYVTPIMYLPSMSGSANFMYTIQVLLSMGNVQMAWEYLISAMYSMRGPTTISQTVTPMDTTESEIMPQGAHSSRKMPCSALIQNQESKTNPGKEYNVLLLGPKGVGKSTFINAFANYLRSKSLDGAVKKDPIVLIPTQCSIPGENHEDTEGQSPTQHCKAYDFPSKNFLLRIIDTPGIGDTRGIDQDRLNIYGILSFLSNYSELHAVCIVLKPNDCVELPLLFAYCIKQLIDRLHASASNNIVFIFTHSRTTFYCPGNTVTPLKTLLDKIRSCRSRPKIPFGKTNIFCLDNETFRYLVTFKNGIGFNAEDHSNFSESWFKSVEESKYLIDYIVMGCNGKESRIHFQEGDGVVNLPISLLEISTKSGTNVQVFFKKPIEYCEDKYEIRPLMVELRTKEGVKRTAREIVQKLEAEIKKYETEQKIFTNSTSKLSAFLKYNLMVLCCDAVKTFLNELIWDETSLCISWSHDAEIIKKSNKIVDDYETLKEILEKILLNPAFKNGHLTNKDVEDFINKLSNVKISGVVFSRVLNAHSKAYENLTDISIGTSYTTRLFRKYFD